MGTINLDWYAAQATRAYPLDDAATARDDAGRELPPQILVDCRVRFPTDMGRFAYVGAVTVSPSIVTAILMAAPYAARPPIGTAPGGAGYYPLGAVSLPRPVVPNRHYPIQPMAPGVGGWLVFGRGINDEPYSGRFSSPAQSLLLPRVASAYNPLPIHTLGKLGVAPALTGVVQLLGANDLEVIRDLRTIDGAEVYAIIIRLVDSLNRNVYSFYTGPCGGRPESGTCDKPVLQAINSVVPDCAGNLTIDFRNVYVSNFADGGGLALDLPLGMADTCVGQDYLPDANGKLPSEYENLCPPPEPPIEPPPVKPPEPIPPAVDCVPLPYYESFDGVIPTAWTVVSGTFVIEADDSPGEPYGLEGAGNEPLPGHKPGLTGLPPLQRAKRNAPSTVIHPIDKSYTSVDQSKRGAAIWNCDYDPSLDLTCTTHLKLMTGPQVNGGIIWDYKAADPLFDYRPTYNLVAVDLAVNALAIFVYRGSSITHSLVFPFNDATHSNMPVIGDWYELSIRTRLDVTHPVNPVMWKVLMTFRGVSNPTYPTKVVDQPWNVVPTGKFGLGTVNAHTRFSFFDLGDTPTGAPP